MSVGQFVETVYGSLARVVMMVIVCLAMVVPLFARLSLTGCAGSAMVVAVTFALVLFAIPTALRSHPRVILAKSWKGLTLLRVYYPWTVMTVKP